MPELDIEAFLRAETVILVRGFRLRPYRQKRYCSVPGFGKKFNNRLRCVEPCAVVLLRNSLAVKELDLSGNRLPNNVDLLPNTTAFLTAAPQVSRLELVALIEQSEVVGLIFVVDVMRFFFALVVLVVAIGVGAHRAVGRDDRRARVSCARTART